MKKIGAYFICISTFLSIILFSVFTANCQPVNAQTIWKSGEGGYKGYRIPAVVVSVKGTIIAFSEGRNDNGDSGDIDLVLKRSTNNGKSWGKEILVWNDSSNTCGNPCPVVDEETGRIWLLLTWNYGKDNENEIVNKKSDYPRTPFICYSDDDGISWSKPIDLSKTCKDPSWGWYATGPGFGIQLKSGKYKGRMVIPANHTYDDPDGNVRKGFFSYGAHVLISDDHGKSWRKSSPIHPGCNESAVTELSDGTILMNMRSYNGKNCRAISFSNDGGETWSQVEHDYQLVESICQASLLKYGTYKGKQIHFFSNPAVTSGRTHMTIKYSENDCRDWAGSTLIDANPSAYSCLVKLPNGNVGIFYETGKIKSYESILFISFRPGKLLNKR